MGERILLMRALPVVAGLVTTAPSRRGVARWPCLLLMALGASSAIAAPVGTAFTYQGALRASGAPARGAYDFEFALFNVATLGGAIATVARDDALVTDGLFTVELDFTDVPFGAAEEYFLEVRVRDGASASGYTQLLPRQKITPTPYAVSARTVQAGGVTQGAIAAGAVGSTQLQAGSVGAAQIADFAVSSAKIANSTITAANIADATITTAKLAFVPGDITAVNAGSGLVGGSASGVATLTVDTGIIQARITGSCPPGEYFRGIGPTGAVTCEPVPGVPRITTVDDSATLVLGFGSSIAIGADGLPVISYANQSNNRLRVAKCANAACTAASTVQVTAPANATSLALGTDGFPVISVYDFTNRALVVVKCADAGCVGTPTITTVDNPNVNEVGNHCSIAVGADGLPVVSYHDFTAQALKVAKCGNPACSGAAMITFVDDPTNFVGEFTSIAIGVDQLPVISYRDFTAGALKVAKCANTACTGGATITTVDSIGNSGRDSSIAIGVDGLPIVSYESFTANSLKVAKCTTPACTGTATVTTVDDPVNLVGTDSSIASGADGLPVISYYDATADVLKLARCANLACSGPASITTVDATGNVGQHSSIAIGVDGLPIVGYFDDTANSLKVAKCGTRACL